MRVGVGVRGRGRVRVRVRVRVRAPTSNDFNTYHILVTHHY